MACQLPEAISKIEEILSKNREGIASAMLSGIQINMLNEAKNNLQSAIEIRMSRMQSNSPGSESKIQEFDKKGFNGYVSIKDTGGKGSAEGDAKDKAMRKVSNGYILEFAKYTPSSTLTSYSELSQSTTLEYLSTDLRSAIEEDGVTYASGFEEDGTDVIMLARNGTLKNRPLIKQVKDQIQIANNSGAIFVVGDMPGVDTQFIEYLNEIGASYKVYTTNEAGKEFDRKGIDGSKYRELVETKPQEVETKSSEPEVKYGSVVKYKPENGTEGYYIVRGITSNGGLQLTDSEGKNFSGTPKVDKVKFVKQLDTKRYNNVDYIVDSNNRAYTKNGKVADSYVNRLLNEFGINKQKQNENEIIKENKNTIKENKSANKYELFPGVYANEDQENAIDDIKDWYKSNKSNTYLLKGRGGTGKTTIVGEVIKQLGIDNRRVVFSAFSNKAVKVLSNSNKDNEYKYSKYLTTAQILKLKPVRDARTGIQKFVTDAYAEEKVTSSDKVIVIDEASMLPNKQQKEIEAKAKNLGIKIIYMGDDVQLPPVDEFDINGKAVKEALVFNEHKKTGDVSELTKRMRQKGESPILPVTDVLANAVKNELDPNKIVFEQGTEINNGQGVVFLNKNAGELDIMEMFLKDFKKDQEGTKYIHYNASDNQKTISKNNIIRRELYGEDFNLPENKYMVGEQVIFDNGYFYQDERTGDNVSIDGATEAKVLESDIIKNKPINYFHGRQKRTIKLDVYSVKVQENDSSGIGYIHNIDIPFNLNRLEEIIKEEQNDLGVYPGGLKDAFASISYSYVITSHKSQGSTYNNAYVDIGNIFGIKATDNDTKLKSAYVATSRPRHKLVMIGANTNGKTVSVDEAIELIKEDSQAYNPQSESDVDNNKYKIISKDDIEAAKDIMSNNKKECE